MYNYSDIPSEIKTLIYDYLPPQELRNIIQISKSDLAISTPLLSNHLLIGTPNKLNKLINNKIEKDKEILYRTLSNPLNHLTSEPSVIYYNGRKVQKFDAYEISTLRTLYQGKGDSKFLLFLNEQFKCPERDKERIAKETSNIKLLMNTFDKSLKGMDKDLLKSFRIERIASNYIHL